MQWTIIAFSSASLPPLLVFSCQHTHTHSHSFPHSHTHIEIYTKSSWCHCSCPRSVLKCSHETGYWLKCDSRIREWTKSDTSQWTLDLHSHLCPLSSQSAFGPDVCSQLNRSHSTTAAAYLELVKGGSYPLCSLPDMQELHNEWRVNKLRYLFKGSYLSILRRLMRNKKISFPISPKRKYSMRSIIIQGFKLFFMLTYKKQSFIQVYFELNEIISYFFVFKWSHAERGLGGNTLHLSVVAQGSSQLLLFSTSLSIPHPSFQHDTHKHTHTNRLAVAKAHKHTEQSISWTQMKCHLQEHILLFHYVLWEEKSTCICFQTETCTHSKGHWAAVISAEWVC